jgi:hypothetical protein
LLKPVVLFPRIQKINPGGGPNHEKKKQVKANNYAP